MSVDLIWLGLALACAAGSALLFRYLYLDHLKQHPLRFALSEAPQSPGGRQFGAVIADDRAVAKIGEMITALMLAGEGWRQLPSQPAGVHGIDGIFVRQLHNSGAYEVRLVETKTSRDGSAAEHYKPSLMTDHKVIEELAKLQGPDIDQHVASAIIHAVRSRSIWFSKWLYSHTLSTGTTVIFPIGPEGELIRRPAGAVQKISTEAHRNFFQSLAIGLSRLESTDAFKIEARPAMKAEAEAAAEPPSQEPKLAA